MNKIIKLDKRHTNILVDIDYESEHQNDTEQRISKKSMQKELQKRFTKKQELFFGLKINNEFVGYATLKPFFPGHKHCELYWLAVRKKYQGKGYGKELMKFIEGFAKKQGFRKVYLYTGKPMKDARAFYERIGYKLVNEFKEYYGFEKGDTTAVLYAKKL